MPKPFPLKVGDKGESCDGFRVGDNGARVVLEPRNENGNKLTRYVCKKTSE